MKASSPRPFSWSTLTPTSASGAAAGAAAVATTADNICTYYHAAAPVMIQYQHQAREWSSSQGWRDAVDDKQHELSGQRSCRRCILWLDSSWSLANSMECVGVQYGRA